MTHVRRNQAGDIDGVYAVPQSEAVPKEEWVSKHKPERKNLKSEPIAKDDAELIAFLAR